MVGGRIHGALQHDPVYACLGFATSDASSQWSEAGTRGKALDEDRPGSKTKECQVCLKGIDNKTRT